MSVHLSKPIEYAALRMNHNVNCELWVITMCQCRFIDCNGCPTLVGILIMGEVCTGWPLCRNSVLSAQFCYDPKTTPKFIREKEYVFYIFCVYVINIKMTAVLYNSARCSYLKYICEPAARTVPESLLEMQKPKYVPRPSESQSVF